MIYQFDIETTGLKPFDRTGRVTMIGIMDENDQTTFIYDNDEKYLLEQFWAWTRTLNMADKVIGFNCLSFDWSYLFKRSIVCNVKPNLIFRRLLLDLRNIIDSDKFAEGKLSDICKLINGQHKTDYLEGGDVIQLFYEGDYETLKIYLKQDLCLTKILYQRLKDCEVI